MEARVNSISTSDNPISLTRSLLNPLAVAAVIIVLVISGVIALHNIRELQQTRLKVGLTLKVLALLAEIEGSVMDAERGQRDFLITGDDDHLKSFDEAIRRTEEGMDQFDELLDDHQIQRSKFEELKPLVQERIEHLRNVLKVRTEQGADAARETVIENSRQNLMGRIEEMANSMRQIEENMLVVRESMASRAYRSGIITSVSSTLIGLVLVGSVLYLLERNRRKAERDAITLNATRERVQLALDAAEMGAWNLDPTTNTLQTDERYRRMHGVEKQELSFEDSLRRIHPDDRARVRQAMRASMSPLDPTPYSVEYRVVHRDGSIRWVSSKGIARVSKRRKKTVLTSFDGTVADVTERKRQEERLQRSEQMALAANQSKSEFLANMSHEIRTPMAAILGYADVLLGHLEDPDNRNCILIMKRNGEHLLSLINDILDLSRIEAGKLSVEAEPVPLPRLVGDIQSLMQVRAEEKNVDFQVMFEGKVPQSIETDPTRLRQVLINLISNAIKFTDEGSVELKIRFIQGAEPPVVEFCIVDTGIGISKEQQDRLFKPFSQGDASVTRKYGGSGLGLAISQRLIEMMEGEMSLESELGEGSTFYVRLPVHSVDGIKLVQPDLIKQPPRPEEMLAETPMLDCRVLVVDDRRDVRHISQHFLEKAGATVATAEDGQDGVDTAIEARDAGQPFDLIVMDMQMPNIDGLQATALLRSAGIDWPIIALTADAMKGDRDRCLNGGCDDYLSKPIDHVQLVSMVASYTQDIDSAELVSRRRQRADDLQQQIEREGKGAS
ncbi:hybrid sensor histidine kinase/response regulator [Rhodopirellula halodulae]|uniref:hybrid sensor histidine kinase/response regulator n=1 Tax=Rhodopirellula halodulae TaxID=2894198 RepID=UPI001E604AFB|nr:ATP-binding protein [Rhodopirellula sp. JC737]MCC9657022.1 response regulator [Rhodopirellula sp. JC737]